MTEEVKAEVIEDNGLSISFAAGSIDANFDALERKVDEILALYEDWEPTADDVAQCASQRKYLNGLAKQIDERRKAVKQQYVAPLNAFEARANAIRDKIKATSARLQAVEKEVDDYRRAELESHLRSHYEDYAGLLVDVVPYEKFHDPRWTNKSFGVKKAEKELEEKVNALAGDWEALKQMGLPNLAAAEARLFDTMDLGDAVKWAKKLEDDQRRIEAMKAELEPQETVPEPPRVVSEADLYAPTHEVDVISAAVFEEVEEERHLYRFRAWLTDSELASFKEWKNACQVGTGWTVGREM